MLYIVLSFVTQAMNDSFTNSLRMGLYSITDIWLPYYVASRALSNFEDYREVVAALIVATALLAVIAVFETSRFWLLYNGVRYSLDLPPPGMLYLTRGIGGLLRAKATTGQPIVLGYLMMIAICLFTFFRYETHQKKTMWLAAGCFAAGLLASLSRGPWIGTAIALIVIIGLGPGKGKRIAWSIGIAGTCTAVLLISPFGSGIIEYLPFVGNIEAENVDYRLRLWQVSLEVARLNPWFGDFDFMRNPMLEAMRQGQGIIDIVNSYVQVLLAHGIVGLLLFILPFLFALKAARRLQHAAILNGDLHVERLGRAMLGTIVGIVITIATVSSIDTIPILYWIVIGLSVGTTRAFYREADNAVEHRPYKDRYKRVYQVGADTTG